MAILLGMCPIHVQRMIRSTAGIWETRRHTTQQGCATCDLNRWHCTVLPVLPRTCQPHNPLHWKHCGVVASNVKTSPLPHDLAPPTHTPFVLVRKLVSECSTSPKTAAPSWSWPLVTHCATEPRCGCPTAPQPFQGSMFFQLRA